MFVELSSRSGLNEESNRRVKRSRDFQDLGALFLLYTSVGDGEGVLNTGKLAEVCLNGYFLQQMSYR